MNELIFATNNQHKVEEVNVALKGMFAIKSLKEAGIDIDIPEPYETLEENALTKARTIFQLTNTDCFSEDTGLEVEALNGTPGVKSARYADGDTRYKDNIDKLLVELGSNTNRSAQFKTIITLIKEGNEYMFEGICKGEILKERRGVSGFGYDSVFVPVGSNKAFAEMTIEEKNEFSHRRKAADKLIDFLLLL